VLVLIPVDIKERVLPEWTDENVKKYFGEELKTKQELIEKIRDEIRKVKKEQQLVQNIEEVLNKVQESFKVEIPKTIIDEEIKARLKSLAERFGGEEGLQKYLENI
jgi:trigger factor